MSCLFCVSILKVLCQHPLQEDKTAPGIPSKRTDNARDGAGFLFKQSQEKDTTRQRSRQQQKTTRTRQDRDKECVNYSDRPLESTLCAT